MLFDNGEGPLLGSNHKSCSCQPRCLAPKPSHLNLNLDRWHISTDMNPDKDLTQKPPYMPHSHMFMLSLQVRPVLNLSERWIDGKKWTFPDCGKIPVRQTLNMKLKWSGSGCLTKEQVLLTLMRQTDHIFWTFSMPVFLLTPEQQFTATALAVSYRLSVDCCCSDTVYNCWTSTSVILHQSRAWKHTGTSLLFQTNWSSSLCLQLFHECRSMSQIHTTTTSDWCA